MDKFKYLFLGSLVGGIFCYLYMKGHGIVEHWWGYTRGYEDGKKDFAIELEPSMARLAKHLKENDDDPIAEHREDELRAMKDRH